MNTLAILFLSVSNTFNLPPNLLQSICFVESGYNKKAVHLNDGGSDSLGICQIKLSTARQLGYNGNAKSLTLNYQDNIYYAGKYLRHQLTRYNENTYKAVAAYNAGSYRNKKANHKYNKKVFMAMRYLYDQN